MCVCSNVDTVPLALRHIHFPARVNAILSSSLRMVKHPKEVVTALLMQRRQIPGDQWPVALSGNLYHHRLSGSEARQMK